MEKWVIEAALRECAREAAKPYKKRQKEYERRLKAYRGYLREIHWESVAQECDWEDL